jgi:hypothetical protein
LQLGRPRPSAADRKRSRKRPRNAIRVFRYEELGSYVRAFSQGHLNLLFVIGEPGLQKSRLVRQVMEASALWMEGHISAFELYRELYRHRDEPVIIDDTDSLYAQPQGIGLLKSLCHTELSKKVSWHTASSKLEDEGIPTTFYTTSRVCIIANDWRTFNEKVAALEDRGHLIFFEPMAEEVHARTAEWFTDAEIFDFIGERLHLIAAPSMRLYVRALELKRANLDWRQHLLRCWLPNERCRLVAELKADPSFSSEEARVERFEELGGGSRATYFRYAKKLERPSGLFPQITLRTGCAEGSQQPGR